MRFELSRRDTTILKGLAVLLMLFHHLFYDVSAAPLFDEPVAGHHWVALFSQQCKVCVAIFVFLSGYGLAKSYKGTIRKYFAHRFVKLYFNYWLIWLLFVPVGIIFFGRTFQVVYQTHIPAHLVIDLCGLSTACGFVGYNPTWWFYSCIVILYALYPLIHKTGHYWLHWLLLAFCIMAVPLPTALRPISKYLLPFVAGIMFGQHNIVSRLTPPNKSMVSILLTLALFVLTGASRFIKGINYDTFLTIAIIETYIILRDKASVILKPLHFIGKHSFNMFLMHTFLFAFYCRNLIYWSRNPLIIFLTLVSMSLAASILIEKIKQMIQFSKLSQKAEQWLGKNESE